MMSVAILKEHFDETAEGMRRLDDPIQHIGNSIVGTLARTGGERYEHALKVVEEACRDLSDIENGVLPLKPRDYYDRIELAINTAAPRSEVWAVSSTDPFQWQADEFQQQWLELNKEAIRRGNLAIQRIFIFDPARLSSEKGDGIKRVIKDHIDHNIKVHLVDPKSIAHLGSTIKESFVLFRNTNCLYRDYPDEGYPGRVLKGELILNDDLIKKSEEDFRVLLSHRIRQDVLGKVVGM